MVLESELWPTAVRPQQAHWLPKRGHGIRAMANCRGTVAGALALKARREIGSLVVTWWSFNQTEQAHWLPKRPSGVSATAAELLELLWAASACSGLL